ncbi:LacI family DNA-binding transcriptional regulator [Roseomonas sp. CCTCC AB2023176]|uniref:LacI family DNA-binding transcriptional regulator n=1 Tax=Roseomonas sp. CCTCC AB2023176 TaxID=3342640 RepID=UPI0035DD435B
MSRSKPTAANLTLVAQAAGVSIATASRVLNGIGGKASEATAAKVQAAAARHGYRPVAAARDLRRGRSAFVAVLAPNLANPTMAAYFAAIEAAIGADGSRLVLLDTHDEAGAQDRAIADACALAPRGIVFLGAVASPGLAVLLREEEGVLLVGRRPPGAAGVGFVGLDDRAAGAEVARLFLAAGAERLGLVHGPLFSTATADRVAGFRDAAGAALDRSDIHTAAGLDHLAIGAAAGRAMLRKRVPEAVMCTSDLLAYGLHRSLADAGVAIPRLCGFDGGPLNPWLAPWLASIAVPYGAVGDAVRDWLQRPGPGAWTRILPHVLRPASPPVAQ